MFPRRWRPPQYSCGVPGSREGRAPSSRRNARRVSAGAAVVGAIAGATVSISFRAIVDGFTALLAVAAFVLFVRGVDAAYLIVGGGVLGAAAFLLA